MSPPHSHDPTVSAASRTSELVLPPTQWSVELVVRVKFRERLAADSGESHRHRSARFPGQASQGSSRARGVIMPGLHQISTPLPTFFDKCVQSRHCATHGAPLSGAFGQSNPLGCKPLEKRSGEHAPNAAQWRSSGMSLASEVAAGARADRRFNAGSGVNLRAASVLRGKAWTTTATAAAAATSAARDGTEAARTRALSRSAAAPS